MTRSAAWSSCNRALDERIHKAQWQAHRDRLDFIQSSSAVSAQAFSSALAASAHPHRIHNSGNSSKSANHDKARSKSPVTKARQKQLDCDNLALIRKIIALDNATPRCNTTRKRTNQAKERGSNATVYADKNTIVIPKRTHSDHECLHTLPDVPQTPASHVLYTRASATMKNNFVEYNAPTMMHSSNSTSAAGRVRSRAQSKILHDNKKITWRILNARTTIDRTALTRHEEKHFKLRTIMSRHRHLAQQQKSRPRSAPQTSCKLRVATSSQTRMNVSNASLVSRIRKMTINNRDGNL
ncbi:uncharacterized protein PITG_17892 [Phytophthora infestans T30-4]|uniref:Uncharacterized protein n=1 Tax=Phytophthora infestans (strain T30-4) TaxID=403677 RepID=D0NWY1_PHYIT|nr:uncharacterized protein PITG_17892 [Phytophthora infestans T30-4]EEY67568.1 conserved hypothetical protein [Phytophthora infestans T30-4]|eukprot:XP_002896427.1 conserved hypothetical protein [Phytophthora infestans T30-4]